ncbi:ATP-binding protein [Mesorhizobium sp. IMUNJ 23232]|uniref:ATP-binding protein n=1 Tax=Mesorhizobium sp. IMUNJ 23232 TaxID=3376064 RepID=UPI0037AF22D6
MFVERDRSAGEGTVQERRDAAQNDKRILGHVVQCDGARATIAAFADDAEGAITGMWTVGKMISINLGPIRTVGLVYAIGKADRHWNPGDQNAIEVSVELIGEVRDSVPPAAPVFDRGVTQYPHIGAVAHRIRSRDLQAVYDLAGRPAVTLGSLSQDETIEARIAIDDTLSRHFAVVGTTGVGKSTAVSLLLRKAIEARPDLRILILDPHNEFASALPEHSYKIDTNSLELPFWLFRLEELAEVLFRGREVVPEEVDVLRDLIPVAKNNYKNAASGGLVRRGQDSMTADLPVPYRIADLIRLIDERMGLLDSKNDRPALKALRTRIESAINDPRYRFMFAARLIEDSIHETIGKIFRVPHGGRPVTCFEMAGLPSEVVNSVCSVLARLAFDLALWSEGKLRLLLMCEEAHRYMPSDSRLGFAPTRHALSRIAKEGRKYGCFLGVVTQRPGELDPTILSQCSTIFAMRLANEQDQAIIRSAIADSSASTLSFLSSMGQREAIAFGDGIATTMRFKFERLTADRIPGAGKHHAADVVSGVGGEVDLAMIVDKLRNHQRPTGPSLAAAEPVEPARQAGDPGYRRAPFPEQSSSQSVQRDDQRSEFRNTGFGQRR